MTEGTNLSGRPVPTHVTTFRINENVPTEGEVEASVQRLRLHKAGGHPHFCAEHFNKCIWEAYPAEGTSPSPRTDRWKKLVETNQLMWHHGDIPREMGWKVLVLIPKGNTDTRGIGLLEFLWKVVEAIIDTHLRASVRLHDILHDFRIGKGTGKVILDLKLAQKLANVDHDPLFLVFLYLHKAYDTVYCGQLLMTLEGYGSILHL